MIAFLINALLFILALFLILLVLVQRGRGGGLAGALGGSGGQSAFGTKAGDVFTKITIVTAAVWILLCAAAVKYYRPNDDQNPFANLPSGAAIPAGGAAPAAAATGTAPAPAATGETPAPAATSTGTGS